MSRLKMFIDESIEARKLIIEADEEAPSEDPEAMLDDATEEDPGAGEEPVEGAEEANDEAGMTDETEEEIDTEAEEPVENTMVDNTDEDFEDIDKTIESMVGITEIQHTTSSTILDFEDGGQIMFVQPMVSVQSETLNKIIALVIEDVKKTYSVSKDEITGKELKKTKYWKSVNTLIETMVRSQLTKSDNIDGLIDEIKQVFKVLEVK